MQGPIVLESPLLVLTSHQKTMTKNLPEMVDGRLGIGYSLGIENAGFSIETETKMQHKTINANPRAISRILNKAEIMKSETSKGKVSDVVSEGYKVFKDNITGLTTVTYISRASITENHENFKKAQTIAIQKIINTIQNAGYRLVCDEINTITVWNGCECEIHKAVNA